MLGNPTKDAARISFEVFREAFMLELVLEFWQFMRQRKKFWLIPIVGFLLILGALVALSSTPVIAPFIYTLF